jgi:hypothetical protein
MSDEKDPTSAGVPWSEVPEFARLATTSEIFGRVLSSGSSSDHRMLA